MERSFLKKYYSSILPAIISSIVLGTFSIIDGLFIGNKVGDIGLAGINFAWPITAFIQAVGFGIGMGGSICISIARGKDNSYEERNYLFHTILLLITSAILMFIVFFSIKHPLLVSFGATGETLVIAEEYITVILIGTLFQVFGQGLVSICRNYKYNFYTMLAMSCGFISNIILDYLFIFVLGWSLKGAAWATFVAQAITSISCLFILIKGHHTPLIKLDKLKIKKILLNAISPFGTFFAPNIILIIINKVAFIYGGDTAVAAYTAVSYVTFMALRLLQGVGDGAQPLFSYYYGSNDIKKEKDTLKISIIINFVIGILLTLSCIIFKNPISYCFGLSDNAKVIFESCLFISALSFMALALIRILMSYFYAKEKNVFAAILVYLEPLIGSLIIFTFPLFMENKLDGIWINTPISQYIMMVIAIILLIKTKRTDFK